MYMHTHVPTHAHTHAHPYMHKHTYMNGHAHINIHACAHTHAHAQELCLTSTFTPGMLVLAKASLKCHGQHSMEGDVPKTGLAYITHGEGVLSSPMGKGL